MKESRDLIYSLVYDIIINGLEENLDRVNIILDSFINEDLFSSDDGIKELIIVCKLYDIDNELSSKIILASNKVMAFFMSNYEFEIRDKSFNLFSDNFIEFYLWDFL